MERSQVKKIDSIYSEHLVTHWEKEIQMIDAISGKQGDTLTDDARLMLYEKAVLFYNNGRKAPALLCFLGCLKGLETNAKFAMLPQCLIHAAKIFAETGDYSKAVQFMQGAKFYYQTAAIKAGVAVDTFKQRMGVVLNGCRPFDLDPCLDEGKRASEYEKLSHICLAKHKFLLALEYCGKAIKLKQRVYGDRHAVTVRSLEMFTLIVAEIGRVHYSDVLQNYASLSESVQDNAPIQVCSLKTDTYQVTELYFALMKGTTTSPIAPFGEMPSQCREILDSNREPAANVVDNACFVMDEKMVRQRISDSIEMLTVNEIIGLVALSLISAFLFNAVWCYFSKSDTCP